MVPPNVAAQQKYAAGGGGGGNFAVPQLAPNVAQNPALLAQMMAAMQASGGRFPAPWMPMGPRPPFGPRMGPPFGTHLSGEQCQQLMGQLMMMMQQTQQKVSPGAGAEDRHVSPPHAADRDREAPPPGA